MLQTNIIKKNIIIGMFAIAANALIASIYDRSDMITNHYSVFIISKWIVILTCVFSIVSTCKNKFLSLNQELVPITAIFYMCSGELFAAGYNLAYTQLIIFIPMMLKIPFWRVLTYLGSSIVLFGTSIYFGQTLRTEVVNYPNYVNDVLISVVTSTVLGFLLAFFVKRYEEKFERMKSKYTNFGLNTSVVIHDLKNNMMAPYRYFSSLDQTPEAIKAVQTIEESMAQLQHILAFHKDNQICNPQKIVKETITAMELANRGIKVIEINECDNLPFSESNLRSVITNAISNSVYMSRADHKNLIINIKYYETGISIRDNGAGFDSEAIENFKNYISSSEKSLGNGIGLINSRLMIEVCGGVMDIYNHEKGGAVVSIKFP